MVILFKQIVPLKSSNLTSSDILDYNVLVITVDKTFIYNIASGIHHLYTFKVIMR